MAVRSRLVACLAAVVLSAVGPTPVVAVPARGDRVPSVPVERAAAGGPASSGQAEPAAPGMDPALTAGLDAVMAVSPPDSCLSVTLGDGSRYGHQATQPLTPASTEKLLTALVAFDRLGADSRFETTVVGTGPVVDGIVQGDLVLVGGGDPVLTTDGYRTIRGLSPDVPHTRLDQLADSLAAAGVRGVSGRVVGDESRYDAVRNVPTWPARYEGQEQSGPLSALGVDDGYVLLPSGDAADPFDREPSADPAGDAARSFALLLAARGIVVLGPAGSGAAPAGAAELASIASPPLTEIVEHMLLASDNQIGELLVKEIGRKAGGGGSTAAGALVVEERAAALGLATAGSDVVDGSGLDPTNKVTCDELVSLLDVSGGLDGTLGPLLPTAGESGTLAGRFRGGPAEGRLHAKTGSLNSVTALAGFVELPEGGVATFAYIANGKPVDASVLGAQDVLGAVLGGYLPPCPDTAPGALVAPVAPYAAGVGTLSMFPLQSVLLPGAVLPLHVFEDRYRTLVERCLAEDEDFGVVLISRGSEVGGGDQRTDVGTRARIVQAEQADDGRWGVLAVGLERIRIQGWLDDDPHPIAEVTDWPDPPSADDVADRLRATAARVRRVLGLRSELGEAGAAATIPLELDDPVLNGYLLVEVSPLGPLDRLHLLATPDLDERLTRLDALLGDEEEACRARLSGL